MEVKRIAIVFMFFIIILSHARAIVRQDSLLSGSSVTCSFEDGLCGWNTIYDGWKIGQRSDGSLGSGPIRDHTFENETWKDGKYIYLDPKSKSKIQPQTLQSPLVRSKDNCFSFWYHMRGKDIGNLTVYIEISGTTSTNIRRKTILWSQDGELDDRWYRAEMTIQTDSDFRVLLEGTSKGPNGDIALDDIYHSHTSCRDTCNFDNGLCSWVQNKSDNFDWKCTKGPTSSHDTGPHSGHTIGNEDDFYMYIDASLLQQGGKAVLRHTGLYRPGRACLSFWYHMYGKHTGTLNVNVRRNGGSLRPMHIWSQSGDQGKNWTFAAIDMEVGPEISIEFESIREDGRRGDIALDDISLSTQSCLDCTFDENLCFWSTDDKWKLSNSVIKGGMYVSSVFSGDSETYSSISSSTLLHSMPGPVCVTFLYFLLGSNRTRLRLYVPQHKDDVLIWNVIGSDNKDWSLVSIPVKENFNNFTLLFEMNSNCNCTGEAGIDGISIKLGNCQDKHHGSVDQTSSSVTLKVAVITGSIAGAVVLVVIIVLLGVLICRKCHQHFKGIKDIGFQPISVKFSAREENKEDGSYGVHSINSGYTYSSNIPQTDIKLGNVKVGNENYECAATKPSRGGSDTYDTTSDDKRPRFDSTYDHMPTNAKEEYTQTHTRYDANLTYDPVTTWSDDVYDKTYVMTRNDTGEDKTYDHDSSGTCETHVITQHNRNSHDDTYEDITT